MTNNEAQLCSDRGLIHHSSLSSLNICQRPVLSVRYKRTHDAVKRIGLELCRLAYDEADSIVKICDATNGDCTFTELRP
jgi:hypothetical protein